MMKNQLCSSVKVRLKEHRLVVGSWVTLAHPAIAEIMADAGFDWLAVDLEHSVITLREAEELIRVISLKGIVPLVRLSSNDPVQIKRVMDAGSTGVIVPMVNSREDVMRAIDGVYYPLEGKRGAGLARAQHYSMNFEEYKNWLENEAIIIVQIEHIDAVKNIREIFSVKEVNGFIIGPYDLSASMGLAGQLEHPRVREAMQEVQNLAAEMKITSGVHVIQPDPAELKRRIDEGYHFIAYSIDFLLLSDNCRRGMKVLKQ